MIVCMSRRICVDMYNAICVRKPDWASNDDVRAEWSRDDGFSHRPRRLAEAYSKQDSRRLANRFRDPDDDLQIVIVRDMWLTGFLLQV